MITKLMQRAGGWFPLPGVLREEFRGYNAGRLRADVLAGITVAAVALPLALAFGIASGATAAAGLVTAIVAGLVIGFLGGAGYQISGPTGAMSAVLIVLSMRYGLQGVLLAGLLSGIMIFLLGVFDLGQIVNFIPSAVIAGFTSGIAIIIFVGQIDNLLGVSTPAAESTLAKIVEILRDIPTPNWSAVFISALVIGIMLLWPKRWNQRFPSSLLGLIAATIVVAVFNLQEPVIGAIPQTILLDDRLQLGQIPWSALPELVAPALSLAALGAIESLLSGTVGGRMLGGARMNSKQELMAQGVGNIVLPFFGGVPATAAIARTSVAIKSGGRTRVVSITHSLILLLALLIAPVLARVPMAALAGVLAVTAWRMNEWGEIRDIFGRRFKTAMFAFLTTMLATIALDLTQTIILGVGLSALIFVFQISRGKVTVSPVSPQKMREAGHEMLSDGSHITVVYVIGPLFFGTAPRFEEAIAGLEAYQDVVLSLRTTPLLDTTGISHIEDLVRITEARGGRVWLCGLNEPVERYLRRAGLIDHLGPERIQWSAFEAIVAADRLGA
ncbi:MAG TPA: SulP family inorganic anion transporter [Candidatus Limnocylindrales bacterium]|nr:SulP family inorganic anion transporter [Candidatus Limnocylindrales bacterium]